MSESENTRLGFLGIENFDDGVAIRGSILITDIDTKPYEFRITSPIRTTFFQRALYGNTLEDYIHIELISVALIRELRESVDLIIVSHPPLLHIRPKISLPVALISNSSKTKKDKVTLLSITTHADFPNEEAVAKSLLTPIMEKRDLLEPFERIKVALTEAHKQKVGESTNKN